MNILNIYTPNQMSKVLGNLSKITIQCANFIFPKRTPFPISPGSLGLSILLYNLGSMTLKLPWILTMWSCFETLTIAFASSSISSLTRGELASLIAISILKSRKKTRLICTWFLKNRVWKIKLDKHNFLSSLNLIFIV